MVVLTKVGTFDPKTFKPNIQTHPLLALICWSFVASGVQKTFIELQEMLQFSPTTTHGTLKQSRMHNS